MIYLLLVLILIAILSPELAGNILAWIVFAAAFILSAGTFLFLLYCGFTLFV